MKLKDLYAALKELGTQHSYFLNNPLKHSDPTGEKWWPWVLGGLGLFDPASALTSLTALAGSASVTAFTAPPMAAATTATALSSAYVTGAANAIPAYISGVIGGKGWDFSEGNTRAKNAWMHTNGMFKSDKHQSGFKRFWQIASRHTLQQPFTNVGYWTGTFMNVFSDAEVSDFNGATVTQTDLMPTGSGITLGSSIMLSKKLPVDYNNTTLLHEYGHYLQQRRWGAVPYLSLSLFSLCSAGPDWRSTSSHKDSWSEKDASARARKYLGNRMTSPQISAFESDFPREFYDGRFFRSYIFNSLLIYLLYDITWSD